MTKPTLNTQQLTQKTLAIIKAHSFFIFFGIFSLLAGYLVVSTGNLANIEPSQIAIDERLTKQKSPVIDKKGTIVIDSLKKRDTSANSKFENTRTNPFE
jgi:hypothetical protein